jgi:predicted RecA/RadA family phage recombinase
MAANFVQEGNVMPFTVPSATTITSGQVVKAGNILGVALSGGTAGQVIQLGFGVFTAPKVSAAVIKAGESLTWDVSANSGAGQFDDNAAVAATGDVTGAAAVAYEDSGATATTLKVKFTGVPGIVT